MLKGNDIGPRGTISLCNALENNATVALLDLNGNNLENEGGMAVAKMLHINQTLTHVNIGNCKIGTETVIALATVLNHNTSVTVLNMENPRLFSLQEESTYHIARMLRVNKTLRELYMGKHKVRDSGAQFFCLFYQF